MKVSSFFKNLDSVSENYGVAFKTPDQKFVPLHFHVTEAATIQKKFKESHFFSALLNLRKSLNTLKFIRKPKATLETLLISFSK